MSSSLVVITPLNRKWICRIVDCRSNSCSAEVVSVGRMTRYQRIAALAAVLMPAIAAAQPVDKTLCVFDPSGAHGDIFKFAESYQAAALAWGVRFKLKPYTDEVVATQDFKAGQCQAVVLTSLRARAFVKTTGNMHCSTSIWIILKSLMIPVAMLQVTNC